MHGGHAAVEAERLRALRGYDILDTPPDGAFDRVTSLAARVFDVPVSIVSLVDEDRIWFKSHHGLTPSEIPRVPGLCASVILSDEAYVVTNALEDPRTFANPLVTGAMGLRFYAAAPLVTNDGYRLGTMNIIDFKARELDAAGEAMLRDLAGIVMDHMELRLAARRLQDSLGKVFAEPLQDASRERLVTICAWTKKLRVGEEWISFDDFLVRKLGVTISHGMAPEAAAALGSNAPASAPGGGKRSGQE